MARFIKKDDGQEYCTKHFQIELTRQQNDFCKAAASCESSSDPDFGGGKPVDDFLRGLLLDALNKAMGTIAPPAAQPAMPIQALRQAI